MIYVKSFVLENDVLDSENITNSLPETSLENSASEDTRISMFIAYAS